MNTRTDNGFSEIQCNKCLKWLKIELFCKDSSRPRGIKPTCRACHAKGNARYVKKPVKDNHDPVARKILEESGWWREEL